MATDPLTNRNLGSSYSTGRRNIESCEGVEVSHVINEAFRQGLASGSIV